MGSSSTVMQFALWLGKFPALTHKKITAYPTPFHHCDKKARSNAQFVSQTDQEEGCIRADASIPVHRKPQGQFTLDASCVESLPMKPETHWMRFCCASHLSSDARCSQLHAFLCVKTHQMSLQGHNARRMTHSACTRAWRALCADF